MNGKHSVEDVFKQCFHISYEGLHRYAYTILKDNEEARDIVQRVFIKLWEKRMEVNIAQSGRSYLYTAVHNLCLNVIRDRKVKDKYANNYFITAKETIVSNVAEEKELQRQIQNAIETLPPKCREIFYKNRVEGKRYAEIAGELNISVKTVEVQISKALKILRTLLADAVIIIIFYFMS